MRILVTLISVLLVHCSQPGVHPTASSPGAALSRKSAVDEAVAATGLHASDPLEIKIRGVLKLLNQDHYFQPKGSPQKLPPPFDQPYHLDSLRTPEEILQQKVGGYCASAALAFSAILRELGVSSEDLRVVAAVNKDDLEMICPEKAALRIEHPRTGASGHVFVALKFDDGNWRLINTVDGSNYESVNWYAPDEVFALMKAGPLAVSHAAYKKFPPKLRAKAMIVFQSWRLEDVPLHTFDQRLDLIASGEIATMKDESHVELSRRCRYGAADVAKIK